MKKVTGIGDIFFKCKDPETMKAWPKAHSGFDTHQDGTSFEWRQSADVLKYGFTHWSPFAENTSFFAPSTKEFGINYSVDDFVWFVEHLRRRPDYCCFYRNIYLRKIWSYM